MVECKQKALIYLLCLVFVSSTVSLPHLAKAADSSIDRYGRSPAALRYAEFEEETRYFAMIGDLFVARPLLLAATGLGTGIFLISLPFSALGGNVKEAASTLVGNPARHTFRRCLGCRFSNLDGDRSKRSDLTSEQQFPLAEPYPLENTD
jgi:hypothetical protein